MSQPDHYIPAFGHESLTPLYDPVLRWIVREETFKRDLIRQAHLLSGQRVLDLGCGTGTLTIMLKQAHPDADVVGVDGDPQVLDLARAKSTKAGVALSFDHGLADQLPYPDSSFDHVLSSLMLHHLTRETKERAAREVWRVLRPGGELHVLDFGRPRGVIAHGIARLARRLERAADNIDGLLPVMFRAAGFDPVEETAYYWVGTLTLYRARKAG